MIVYMSPILRRRSRREVVAWMTALSLAAGQGVGAEGYLLELMSVVVEHGGGGGAA